MWSKSCSSAKLWRCRLPSSRYPCFSALAQVWLGFSLRHSTEAHSMKSARSTARPPGPPPPPPPAAGGWNSRAMDLETLQVAGTGNPPGARALAPPRCPPQHNTRLRATPRQDEASGSLCHQLQPPMGRCCGLLGASSKQKQQHQQQSMASGGNADGLRDLARAAEGFGAGAVGGLEGPLFCVTSLADDGAGTLREACRKTGPLWIVFHVSGTIFLNSYLRVSSFKTIDGRGQQIKIVGKGLQLKECQHVIVCNLLFEAGRGHDVDGIQMKPNSSHIWIDRCTLSDFDDGLIDITRQCTDITISRCRFFNHDKTMLIGADPKHVEDRCMRITIHHCLFDGTRQRHPRVRFAKVHLYNNYTRNWGIYAVCASVEAQIVSQACIYEAGANKKAFEYYTEQAADRSEPASGCIRSEGDLFLKGAQGVPIGPESVFRVQDYYTKWSVEPADQALMKKLCTITGWQDIALPEDKR